MSTYFIHPSSLVETKAIGEKTTIWAFVHILPGAHIGSRVNICDHVFIENKVIVGNNVTIKSGVYLWDGITIEDNVFIGPAAVFTNDIYPRSKNNQYIQKKTVLKRGSSVGANATVLAGVTMGKYSMIGAGSVVTKNIPDFALAYGNPAQVKGFICICTKKISLVKKIYICECGKKYVINKNSVQLEILK